MNIHLYLPLALHEQGRRDGNEDSIYPDINDLDRQAETRFFMVCDGVGGLEKGEEASRLACSTFAKNLLQTAWIGENEINYALSHTEQAMDDYIRHNPEAEGMATTMTLAAFHQKGVTVAHVGDSRVYHIRGGQILFKTTDHSLVNELIAQNIITPEEAVNHPQRNVISRAIVGSSRPTKASVCYITDIQAGDYFFLCTDGVLESLSDLNLALILNQNDVSDEAMLEQMLNLCRQNSKDNFSAYLLHVKVVEEDAKANNAPTPNLVSGSYKKEKRVGKLLSGMVVGALGLLLILAILNSRKDKTALQAEEPVDSSMLQYDYENAVSIIRDSLDNPWLTWRVRNDTAYNFLRVFKLPVVDTLPQTDNQK